MKKTTIFIIGINSFVGTSLTTYFKRKGFKVMGSVTDLSKGAALGLGPEELYVLNLGGEISSHAIPDDLDIIIYAAHDKRNASNNLESNKQIYELARSKNCGYHIFISSISANSTNDSDYGRVKLELEQFFLDKVNTAIIRPGLVIGNGGLYYNMECFIKKHHLVPLPDGGKYKMATIEIQELSLAIEMLIKKRLSGIFNLYNPRLISLNEIVRNIARINKKKIFIIHIPISLAQFFFSIFKSILYVLKINNQFSIDSISGYKLYKKLKLEPSDLARLLRDNN
jgi:nucleoside-diphosphate-sugar epimerase